MSFSFYSNMNKKEQNCYKKLLGAVGGLSKLFNDSLVPYLYYRTHENVFCKTFKAKNLSRADVSYDAECNGIGIGLKTFLHQNGKTLQKIAEFNSVATSLKGLSDQQLVLEISRLRNKRIETTNVQYGIRGMIYHCITRTERFFKIYEYPFDFIEISNIKILDINKNTILFKDGKHEYSFNKSKSTLYQRFILNGDPLDSLQIKILNDPYAEILKIKEDVDDVFVNEDLFKPGEDFIILPLYAPSDLKNFSPAPNSGLNQWNAKGRTRNKDEAYIPIPSWIFNKCPNFFQKKNDKIFSLTLPNKTILKAKLCQSGSKALMSNPNKDLGRWLLRDLLKIAEDEIVTRKHLEESNIDSVIVYKINSEKYEIDFASLGKFEDFRSLFQ